MPLKEQTICPIDSPVTKQTENSSHRGKADHLFFAANKEKYKKLLADKIKRKDEERRVGLCRRPSAHLTDI